MMKRRDVLMTAAAVGLLPQPIARGQFGEEVGSSIWRWYRPRKIACKRRARALDRARHEPTRVEEGESLPLTTTVFYGSLGNDAWMRWAASGFEQLAVRCKCRSGELTWISVSACSGVTSRRTAFQRTRSICGPVA
jgi:hypothetical protein